MPPQTPSQGNFQGDWNLEATSPISSPAQPVENVPTRAPRSPVPIKVIDEQHPEFSNVRRAIIRNFGKSDATISAYLSGLGFDSTLDADGRYLVWKKGDLVGYRLDRERIFPTGEEWSRDALRASLESMGEMTKDVTDGIADTIRIGTGILTLIPRFSGIGLPLASVISGGSESILSMFAWSAGIERFDFGDVLFATVVGTNAKLLDKGLRVGGAAIGRQSPEMLKRLGARMGAAAGNYAVTGGASMVLDAERQVLDISQSDQSEYSFTRSLGAGAGGMIFQFGAGQIATRIDVRRERLRLASQLSTQLRTVEAATASLRDAREELSTVMRNSAKLDEAILEGFQQAGVDTPQYREFLRVWNERQFVRAIFTGDPIANTVSRELVEFNITALSDAEQKACRELFMARQSLQASLEWKILIEKQMHSNATASPIEERERLLKKLGDVNGKIIEQTLEAKLQITNAEPVYIVRGSKGIEVLHAYQNYTVDIPNSSVLTISPKMSVSGSNQPVSGSILLTPGRPARGRTEYSLPHGRGQPEEYSVLTGAVTVPPGTVVYIPAESRTHRLVLPRILDMWSDFVEHDPRLANLMPLQKLTVGRAGDLKLWNEDLTNVSRIHLTLERLPDGSLKMFDGTPSVASIEINEGGGWTALLMPRAVKPGTRVKIDGHTEFSLPDPLALIRTGSLTSNVRP